MAWRPVYGGTEKLQSDPFWRDNILFYEYFHGDNGAGLVQVIKPATGLVAKCIELYGFLDANRILEVAEGLRSRKNSEPLADKDSSSPTEVVLCVP